MLQLGLDDEEEDSPQLSFSPLVGGFLLLRSPLDSPQRVTPLSQDETKLLLGRDRPGMSRTKVSHYLAQRQHLGCPDRYQALLDLDRKGLYG